MPLFTMGVATKNPKELGCGERLVGGVQADECLGSVHFRGVFSIRHRTVEWEARVLADGGQLICAFYS